MTEDEDQLRLLAIFHYVVGGLTGVIALIPSLHLTIGLLLILAPEQMQGNGPPVPAFLGWFLAIFGAVLIIIGWSIAGCIIAAGRFLSQHKHHTFCLVVAGVECLFFPLGTALGIFAIIVLMRNPVTQLFEANKALEAPADTPGH